MFLVDLEPVRAAAVVGGRRLSGGHLGEPGRHGPRVADAGLDVVRDGAAGLDARRGRALAARGQLVAGHGGRGHVRHGAVALVVCCFADIGPVSLGLFFSF